MSLYTLTAGGIVSIDGTPTFAISRIPQTMSPPEQEEMARRIVKLLNSDDGVFDGDRIAVCSNFPECGREWLESHLSDVENFFMRVSVGETCPAGQCPACGSLCYMKHISLKELRPIKVHQKDPKKVRRWWQ